MGKLWKYIELKMKLHDIVAKRTDNNFYHKGLQRQSFGVIGKKLLNWQA